MVFSVHSFSANQSSFIPSSFSAELKEKLEENFASMEKPITPEKIEKLSWLTEATKYPLSTTFQISLFALESGDPFIKNSSLEGQIKTVTLTRFIDCLQRVGFTKYNLAHLKLYEDCLFWAYRIQGLLTGENFSDKISELSDDLVQRVSGMGIGARLLLPGGWTNGVESGHALLYLIQKNKNSYSFSVYNTGMGLGYHEGIIENHIRKADIELKVEKIHSNQICQREFFQALIELQSLPVFDHSLKFSDRSLYEGPIAYLKGKRVSSSISNMPELMRKPQHSGSCAMEVLFGSLRSMFMDHVKTYPEKMDALNAYRKVKFAYRKQSLVDACLHFFDPTTTWTRTSHKLISEVSSKLARDTLKMRADNLLTEEEFEAYACTAIDIKQRLAEKKQRHLSTKKTSALLSFELKEHAILVKADLSQPLGIKKSLEPILKNHLNGLLPIIPFEKFGTIAPENILEFLKDGKKQIEAFATVTTNSYQVIESVSRFLYALPLPGDAIGRKFWDEVPDVQITTCLELLFDISAKYFTKPELFLPRTIIGSHISLAIGEYLARRQHENHLTGYPLDSAGFIAFAQSPHFTFEDPCDQQKLQDVLSTLAPSYVDVTKNVPVGVLNSINKESIFSLIPGPNWTIKTDEETPEIKYYRALMYTPSISQELDRRGIGSYEKRLTAFFQEKVSDQNLIPSSVLYLRQLSYFATGLLQNQVRMTGECVFKNDFFFGKNVIVLGLKNLSNQSSVSFRSPLNFETQSKDYILKFFSQNKKIKKSFTHHFMGLEQNQFMRDIQNEEVRDRYISSTVLQDEVVRALAYYQERPEALLEDVNEQEILKRHILKPRTLLMQLYNEPTVALKLLSFINNRLVFFQNNGKKNPALFFCRLGNICNRYIQHVQNKHPERFLGMEKELEEVWLDYHKRVTETILPKCQTPEEVEAVCQTLKSMHIGRDVQSLNNEELLEIAQDYFRAEIYTISADTDSSSVSKTDQFYTTVLPKIQHLLDEDITFRHALLNAVLSQIKGEKIQLIWEGHFPHFKSDPFWIDLASKKIYESGVPFSPLSRDMIEHPLFTKIFPQIPKVKSSFPGGCVVIDKNGESKIGLDQNGNLFVERMIDGIAYAMVKEVPVQFTQAISYDLFQHDPIIWQHNGLRNAHYLIQSLKSSKNAQKDFRIYYQSSIFSDYSLLVSDEMHPPFKYILVDPWHEKGLSLLEAFENRKHIACWAETQDTSYVKKIEMPRMGLHFNVVKGSNGNRKAFCREVPGYYLAEDQKGEFGTKWPKYLVLENAFGQKKVLMPKNPLVANEKDDLPFDVELLSQGENTAQVIIYDDEVIEGERRLKPSSVEDSLYLVYLYFSQKDYKKAFYYLKKSYSLGPFSKSERAIILNMINKFFGEGHPSAVVLGLKAVLLFKENQLKYVSLKSQALEEDFDEATWKKITSKYVEYIQNLNNATRGRLSSEEEKSLLRFFISKEFHGDPQIGSRINILMNRKTFPHKLSSKPYKKSFEKATTVNCVDAGRFFDLFLSNSTSTTSTNLMDLKAKNLRSAYRLYYNWARHGSKQEKKHLERILALLKGSRFYVEGNPFEIGTILILKEVLKRPRNFPSVEEINQVNRISNVDEKVSAKIKLFQTRILKNIKKKSSIAGFFKNIYRDLFSLKQNRNLEDVEDLLVQMPTESEKKASSSVVLNTHLKALDKEDDHFFDHILKTYMVVKDIKVSPPVEFSEIDNEDPLSQAYLNRLKKGMEQFYEISPKTSRRYHFHSTANIMMLEDELQAGLEKSMDNLQILEQEILSLINVPMEFQGSLKQAGKLTPALNLSQAVELFEQGNQEAYKEKTHLRDDQVAEFEKLMTQYLVVSTRREQALRILKDVIVLQKIPDDGDERNTLIQKIGNEIASRRHYSEVSQGHLARTFLLFEHRNKILLRKKQIDFLEKIFKHPYPMQLITQLGTGSGKSKVLAPFLEWLVHQHSRLVFNLWPSALYQVNKNDMKSQVRETFNQISDAYEFERAASTDLYHLIFARRELKKARQEKRQLNATPESLQCTELKFLETLYIASLHNPKIFSGKIFALQNILKEFLSSEAHCDEEHVTLSAKKEVNFTIGDPFTEPLENILFLEEIFRFIASDPEIIQKMNVKENLQHLVSEEVIKQEVTPRIAQHMGEYLKLESHLHAEFCEYVLGQSTAIPKWILTHPRKQEIGLLKGELTALLPSMLSNKIVNVHYGLSHLVNGPEYAKPYEASDSPIETADYDNIHETLNKTYLTYLNKRLSTESLWKLVNHLQSSALAESKIRLMDVKKTAACLFFEKCFPQGMKELFLLEKSDIKEWANAINQNDDVIFHYVKVFVAPSIKKYALKLKSDSQNLRSQLGSLLAMSATPGNPSMYGLSTKYQGDLGSDERVLDVLSKKCADPSCMHILTGQTSAENLESLFEKILPGKTDFRMLIDIGALFKDIGGEIGSGSLVIAKRLLAHLNKNNSEIRGVVFFHEDQLKVLEVGRNKLIPLEQSQLTPHQRFTFCDQKHMFGADVKQFSRAKGIATFSKHTTKDDLLQGVGRLRELLEEQTVEWATTEDIYNVIAKPEEIFTYQKLLSLAIRNQAEQEADDLYRSIKQQMRNDIRSILMRKLIHAKSEKDAIALFKDFSPILIEKVELDAFKIYGGLLERRTDAEDLIIYRNQLLTQLKQLKLLKKSEKKAIQQQLLTYDLAIKERECQLSAQKKQHFVEIGVEAEIQQNVETNVEINRETHNNDDEYLQLHSANKWRRSLNLYTENWIKPSSTILFRIKKIVASVIMFPPVFFSFINNIAKKIEKKIHMNVDIPIYLATLPISIPLIIFTAGGLLVYAGLSLIGRIAYLNSSCLLFSADAVIKNASDRKISSAHAFFKNSPYAKLIMTNNFVTLKPKDPFKFPMQPLGKEQRSLYEVLVVEDELPNGAKQFSVIMGDQSTDGVFWRKKLLEDREKTSVEDAQKRKRRICLYDLHMGIVQNGKIPFDEKELKNNPHFLELIVKAKLYNAESSFNDQEEAALIRLFSDNKIKKKIRAFFERALIWHHAKQSKFYNSFMHALLKK